jgi:hypothetical protein
MGRGGYRSGSGRKPGIPNKPKPTASAKAYAAGPNPIDIMLNSMRALYDNGDFEAAGALAAKVAPFIHSKFAPTAEPAARHPAQVARGPDLFEHAEITAGGKPAASEWDGLLN